MADPIPNVVVSMPTQLFTRPETFSAVSNGRIYIGTVDSDPTVMANQLPVYIEGEDGSTTQIPQPLRTNTGGYPVYNGQIVKFVTTGNYSMTVQSSIGVQLFYFPNLLKYDPAQLEQRLISDADGSGDAMIAVKQPGVTSVHRTVHNKMAESVSISDYGALPGVDASGAIINALSSNSGEVIIPPGGFVATPTLSQVPAVLSLLSRAEFRGQLDISLPTGTAQLSSETKINCTNPDRCTVSGVSFPATVTGLVGVSGAAKNYLVTVSISGASNASAGDYLIIRHDIAGTDFPHIH
jgi:hypothetical protein